MAADELWYEGYDKYGLAIGRNDFLAQLIAGGEWTSSVGLAAAALELAPPLGAGADANGRAVYHAFGNGQYIQKGLGRNCARLIGGFVYKRANTGSGDWSLAFGEGATVHCTLRFIYATGKIALYRGDDVTLLHTTDDVIPGGTDTFVAYDITFSNTVGIAKFYINGTLTTLNLSAQDLCSSANEYCNFIRRVGRGTANFTVDHEWLQMFNAGGSGDTIFVNPFIKTQFPNAEGATADFVPATMLIGPDGNGIVAGTTEHLSTVATAASLNINTAHLRKVTIPAAGNITHVKGMFNTAVGLRPIVYSDNAGVPDALLGSGAEITVTSGYAETSAPLSAAVAVTAGQIVWVGFMGGTAGTNTRMCGTNAAASAVGASQMARTYSSGPAATFTHNGAAYDFWFCALMSGMTAAANNADVVGERFPRSDHYVEKAGSASVDILAFPALDVNPETIFGVAVKAMIAATGGENVDLQMRDTATGNGSNPGIVPGAGFGYKGSYFTVDPDTSAAWTKAGLDAAKSAVEIN